MGNLLPLTHRQKELLRYIEDISMTEKRMPSYREMASALGLSAVGSVQDLIRALIDKGYLSKKGRHVVLSRSHYPANLQVPVVGSVAAGSLSEAIEDHEGLLTLSTDLLPTTKGASIFALRVRGDSMVEAGIFAGDFVIVQRQQNLKSGDTVVARYRGEATVKEIHFQGTGKNRNLILRPRNRAMSDITFSPDEISEVEILGKVVALQRVL